MAKATRSRQTDPEYPLINSNHLRAQRGEALVWLQSKLCFWYMRRKTLNSGLAGWGVWLDRLCVCKSAQSPHVVVCVFASVSTAWTFMYIQYVCYEGVSHTPAGLWSPESEEDTDTEQRRLLAAPEPWSMLGWKPACRRACLVRWSLLMKHLSHIGQLKRFSPVCVR